MSTLPVCDSGVDWLAAGCELASVESSKSPALPSAQLGRPLVAYDL